ncbi:MAG: hypothetical protein RLZ25_313 [Pseudomonadota bacterium]
MSSLEQIENRIDALIQNIRTSYPDWLCRRGCDECCRRLASLPLMTRAEWIRLKEGLLLIPSSDREDLISHIHALSGVTGFVVCPMLDPSDGACRVYAHRPLACRTYGYYTQKGVGLHCKQIEHQIDQGLLGQVVWGNQDALEKDLRAEGSQRSLAEWIACPRDGMDPRATS